MLDDGGGVTLPPHEEVPAMEWDLGPQGLAVLALMSLAFGAVAQVVLWSRATHWLWLISAVGYMIGGIFISEVLFGWATVEELQPNIDGLSFDEVLLIGFVPGILVAGISWYLTRRARTEQRHAPT
jgi:hypothetical protein